MIKKIEQQPSILPIYRPITADKKRHNGGKTSRILVVQWVLT